MSGPLIVQSDLTILAEAFHPLYPEVRKKLSRFAELVKSPEFIHTYIISDVTLWNACSCGIGAEEIIEFLKVNSRFEIPLIVQEKIRDSCRRYGLLKIYPFDEENLLLRSEKEEILEEILNMEQFRNFSLRRISPNEVIFPRIFRGNLKWSLSKVRFPPLDLAGYEEAEPLDFKLRDITLKGQPFRLRDYQREAVEAFWDNGSPSGGNGVIVLPCGAGKTIVGMGVMEKVCSSVLILVTTREAAVQWIEELLDKSFLKRSDVGIYTGKEKEIAPVTVATYNILIHRKRKDEPFTHFGIFDRRKWGLIIYDEVHILPAPVFRITATLQSKRRLGLTATLIREDGKEIEVFSLVGPKRYDAMWKGLEEKGYIAHAECYELRVPLSPERWRKYISSPRRQKFRIASENLLKDDVVERLIQYFRKENILVIGQYIEQLKRIAMRIGAPLITGSTPHNLREGLFSEFKNGKRRILVVSKVANYALDLPDASIAIQVSGTFGSRQEEAQRLGRILRPKKDGRPARFFSLVSDNTIELDFAEKRQMFLAEQGYSYSIINALDIFKKGKNLFQ